MGYTVIVMTMDMVNEIGRQDFDDLDKANEFAMTWAINGFFCSIVNKP